MDRAVAFYADVLELPVVFGGPESDFTSLQLGENFVNLFIDAGERAFWGRVILHVDDVDAVYATISAAIAAGRIDASCSPHAEPRDAPWGERYFHANDPDGHELSFARRLG